MSVRLLPEPWAMINDAADQQGLDLATFDTEDSCLRAF